MMNSWKTVPLIALADYINGYAFKPEDHTDEGLPIIRIEQLKDDSAELDHYDKSVPEYNLIHNGDLIFSWSASLFLRIWDRGDAILNQHLFKVIPYPDVDKQYLKYCIEYNLPKLSNSSHGSTMKHITRKELKRFHVSLPSEKKEQAKIAEVLAIIDRAIAQTEVLIAKHQRIRTGLMQDLLTRGIDEHGQLRDLTTHKFKHSRLGSIPEEWEESTIGKISDRVTSGSRWWARYYADAGAKFIRIGNLTREHVNLRLQNIQHVQPPDSSEAKRTVLETGDLLISVTADLGIIGIVPSDLGEAYINQHIALVKLDKEKINPYFIGNLLSGFQAQKYFSLLNDSGAKAGLNLKTISAFPVVFPSDKKEQYRIAEIIQKTDGIIEKQKSERKKLLGVKAGLMQDLLSGRVSVKVLMEG